MRLKQIKLAGFKSFVDITSIPFPQEMTAIVGPNGCGKSNVIDAVRWVLGESSAKNLRGDQMTDVIFNGSSSRKPVGQASVELIFDNSESRVQGSMADRTEISIRRVVNRDSQNTYFLNGSKCRRKDITDIFLGTGLGPRSYAIIEQGMISKLIESKPQDLRVFLEEAAGISKYKERRRETETRIRHTRENLSRLADIRHELSVSLEKLYGQSIAAKRFKELKGKERKLKAELIVLRWKQHQQKLQQAQQKQQQINADIEQQQSLQITAQTQLFKAKGLVGDSNDELATLQQKQVSLTADITRCEQTIKHHKQQHLSYSSDIERITKQQDKTKQHLQQQHQEREQLNAKIGKITPIYADTNVEMQHCSDEYQKTQDQLNNLQQQLQQAQLSQSQHIHDLELNNNKLNACVAQITSCENRLQKLVEQESQTNIDAITLELKQLSQKADDAKGIVEELTCKLDEAKLETEHCKLAHQKINQQKQNVEKQLMQLHAQYKATHANASELSDWQIKQARYLTSLNIDSSATLIELLDVEEGWEKAIEMVLSPWLDSVFVDHFPLDFNPDIASLVKLSSKENVGNNIENTLASKVKGSHPFNYLFAQVLITGDSKTAHEMSKTLSDDVSVICPQGYWYARNWFKKGINADKSGALKRLNDLHALEQTIKVLETDFETMSNQFKHAELQLQLSNERVQDFHTRLNEQQQVQQQVQQQSELLEQQIQLQGKQQQLFETEIIRTKTELANLENQKRQLQSEQQQLNNQDCVNPKGLEELMHSKEAVQQRCEDLKKQLAVYNEQLQLQRIEVEKSKTQLASLELTITREQQQLNEVVQQLIELQQNQQKLVLPLEQNQNKLQTLLAENSQAEQALQKSKSQMQSANANIDEYEKNQQQLNIKINKLKDKYSSLEIESQNHQVRTKTALEQLLELNQNLDTVLANIPDDAKESQWQIELARINKDVSTLGAINLAAIEEYNTQAQRKDYLEQQNNDLEKALTTLESAINKINQESRQKFKGTFEQVNSDLKELFPKVFGGGSAYLDLTDDDLLEAGVTIMARPPGKKNSTIHLLSGGEKALTALSLVFAIFRLNPAPFCLLDEVDAPLDDANVGRFCNLVKEMSQTVQFIYISHNKIAMEMASHLTGVTMFEPGVSRMVAVDIDEAIALAEVS